MAIPAEIPRQVEAIMREHLLRNFPGGITFDPVLVEPMIGWQGDENLRVTVVYDGDVDLVDGAKINAVAVAILPALRAIGFHKIPIDSYVDKAEWLEPVLDWFDERHGLEPSD